MPTRSPSRLSESERDDRRRADRERLKQAAEELLSSEGWQRWVRTRASFHAYSAGNCMLLALQCHQRGIEPQHIAGFRAWLNLGRCVRKGEAALRILAPITVKERNQQSEDRDLHFFRFSLRHSGRLGALSKFPRSQANRAKDVVLPARLRERRQAPCRFPC